MGHYVSRADKSAPFPYKSFSIWVPPKARRNPDPIATVNTLAAYTYVYVLPQYLQLRPLKWSSTEVNIVGLWKEHARRSKFGKKTPEETFSKSHFAANCSCRYASSWASGDVFCSGQMTQSSEILCTSKTRVAKSSSGLLKAKHQESFLG